MTTYHFTTNELASKLPLGRGAVIHSIKWVKMAGDLQDQAYIRAGYNGRPPTGTNVMSANMVELMLGLDGNITDIQQDGDQVTVTTDAEPEPATIYDRARQTIEGARQWPSGDAVTIWQGKHARVYVREYQGLLSLNAVNGDPRKVERVRCGFYSPRGGFRFDLDRAGYDRWASRAKQLLSA